MTWTPELRQGGAARYLQLADAIASGIQDGTLSLGDRLPPQRRLADQLGIDFTTVSRGYGEARRRGLVNSHVGRGTFVSQARGTATTREMRRSADIDLTMNLPPEPDDPTLLARMESGLQTVSANLVDLLRYQSSTGGQVDKEAASSWLSLRGLVPTLDRIAVTPGAHPTMLAILMGLTQPGDTVLCEDVTYPGFRGIAGRLGLRLIGLPGDPDGIDTEAL
ncbi:MAG: GntR family transcriptional regulator, partial [Pseudomonadota bacterium]